jgi:Uma2 family endonuclease
VIPRDIRLVALKAIAFNAAFWDFQSEQLDLDGAAYLLRRMRAAVLSNQRGVMQAEVTKKLFTVDEYYRMVDAGILSERDRVELIEGEIVEMSPIGQRHVVCVDRANHLFTSSLNRRALISVQTPLRLNKYNEPQPDIVVMKWQDDYYSSKRHTPEDTLFVVEVSDTTLRYDTKIKLPLYAVTGVPELWIENLKENVLLVCRNPSGRKYNTQLTLTRADAISPLAFPDVSFKIADLLG